MNEERWISRTPSLEMSSLASKIEGLYNRENHYICSFTSINFVGSIILNDNLDLVFDETNDIEPITLASNIPLLFEDKQRNYSPLGFTLKDVLVKNACGRGETGVVLNGPLAGLIVDNYQRYKPICEGMVATKVWNDDLLDHFKDTDGTGKIDKYNNAMLINGSIEERRRLVKLYMQVVNSDKTLKWTTDIFFRFCHQRGYPLDESQFHYSRSLKDLTSAV